MTYTQEDFERLSDTILVRFDKHLIRELLTRDADGNALTVHVGEPDDGVYTLMVEVDYDDNPYRDLKAENKRLRSCLEVTEEVKHDWKARAEAAEKVCEVAKAHVAIRDCFAIPDPMDSDDCPYCRFEDVCAAIAALAATKGGAE